MDEDRDHKAWVAALLQALEDGRPLDLAPGEDVDVSHWPESRRLPGEALRAALLQPDVQPDPRGLKIRRAYITGSADLAGLKLPHALSFDRCAFEQRALWSRLTVAHLHLTECTTRALVLNEAHIDGQLNLDGLRATTAAPVGITIGSDLSLRAATLTNNGESALLLDRADIKGQAFLNSVTVSGRVQALGATIVGPLYLDDAQLSNEGGIALSLDRADVNMDAFLESVTVAGVVQALGATIGGNLSLRHASLVNEGGFALALDGADIKGGAFLDPVTVTGEVHAIATTIGGEFRLEGARLNNERGTALNLQLARLPVVGLDPAVVNGAIRLDGAQITELLTPRRGMTVLTSSESSASGGRLGDVRGRIRHDRRRLPIGSARQRP